MNILLIIAVVALVVIAVASVKMAWQPKVVAAAPSCHHHNIVEYLDNEDWRLAGIASYQCGSCFKDFGHCKPDTMKN